MQIDVSNTEDLQGGYTKLLKLKLRLLNGGHGLLFFFLFV